MRVLPVNLDAVLVELQDARQTLNLFESLQARGLPGVKQLLPAAKTLLIRFDPQRTDAPAIVRALGAEQGAFGSQHQAQTLIDIPVFYDGDDLPEVAALLDLSPAQFIEAHSSQRYRVAFMGFSPGFGYMLGESGINFEVPRRQSPRTRIPAGSVALAGQFSGVYPQASPGGWQLIGRTPLQMWALDRDPPALLQPGMQVNFVPQTEQVSILSPEPPQHSCQTPCPKASVEAAPAADSAAFAGLDVLSCGIPPCFQDEGRVGLANLGIPGSGALDQCALHQVNRIVGNAQGTAVLEIPAGNLKLKARAPLLLAAAGALCELSVQTRQGQRWQHASLEPFWLDPGDILQLGPVQQGFRVYLSVRGGFQVQPVLGSRSRDSLSGMGPELVRPGQTLFVHALAAGAKYAPLSLGETRPFILPAPDRTTVLRVVLGPRTDWFTQEAVSLFLSQTWQTAQNSDRVGLRLQGEHALGRKQAGELPSEGTLPGSIQVPADGQPVLFLRDHPVTGGYPVIAGVISQDLDLAGQLPPGSFVRFQIAASFETFRIDSDL